MVSDELCALFLKCLTVAVCVLVVSVASCTANTHYQITQALMSNVDPLAVACAHGGDGTETSCVMLASKRKD